MAKKKTKKSTAKKTTAGASAKTVIKKRSKRGSNGVKTTAKLEGLAESVVENAFGRREPAIDIPIRALSNVSFNSKTRYIEMGDRCQQRSLFNYGQAKRFMQTLLVASKCKELVDADKTASIRQIYYLAKHTIKGTKEKTFDSQDESDPVIEDLEVALEALREELHVFAGSKGTHRRANIRRQR
ncbi:MAG: hypothetical protein R3E58_18155 [Phycisphaerae bacterium]